MPSSATKEMCQRCGNNPAIGGSKEEYGVASQLCVQCVRNSIRKGLCPSCEYEDGSLAHNVRCGVPLGPDEDEEVDAEAPLATVTVDDSQDFDF